MTKIRYFAGNTLASFIPDSTANWSDTTTAGHFNATYTDLSMTASGSGATLTTPLWAAAESTLLYTKLTVYRHVSVPGTHDALIWYNGSGTALFKLDSTGQFYSWNGSSWAAAGSAFSIAGDGTLNVYVIKIDMVAHTFQAWQNNILVASGSINSAVTALQQFVAARWDNSTGQEYSEVMIANYDITNSHLMHAKLNGNSSTNTGGTGAYTTVEKSGYDDTTFATVSVSGNKQGWTHAAISVPVNYDLISLVETGRGLISGVITDGKLGARSGTTNSSSAGLGYTSTIAPKQRFVDTDPNTSAAWTQSGFNSAEVYMEAA